MRRFVCICTVPAFAGLLFLSGCTGKGEGENIGRKQLEEPLIKINKTVAEIEKEQIDAYIHRHNWEMTETGTGLRYMIYQKGYGAQAKESMIAVISYEVSLLNGDVCYSSKEKGPEEFLIGRDDVESGLHEGITYLHVGDKAKLILPSHLAHGLLGDLEKIPPRSTIIYDVELLGLR